MKMSFGISQHPRSSLIPELVWGSKSSPFRIQPNGCIYIYQRQRIQVAFVSSILLCLIYYMLLNFWGSYTETINGP